MKQIIAAITLCVAFTFQASAQKYLTRTGTIKFESNTEIDDDVRATNENVACVLDATNGALVFQVAIKSFNFKKALMQEHFNENYLESTKFPKSVFKGTISNWSELNQSSTEKQKAIVEGELEIHGVKQTIKEEGFITFNGDNIVLESHFLVSPESFDIKIPNMVRDKIAENIDVDLNMTVTKQ